MRALLTSSLLLTLAAVPAANAAVIATEGPHELGSKGYFRVGTGTSDGDTQVCYKAPGAGSKYRLGNECEQYGKASLYYRYNDDDSDFYLQSELQAELKGNYGEDVEYTQFVRKYVELGNLFGTPVDFWVGRRYGYRRDVHITDYFYWKQQGDGFGIRDIPLGPVNLAYHYYEEDQFPTGAGLIDQEAEQRNHDLSLYGWESNPGGTVNVDLRFSEIDGGTFPGVAVPVTIHDVDGWGFAVQHRQKGVWGGTNTLVLQYGEGAARGAWSYPMESASVLGDLTTATAAGALEDADTWRLLDFHIYQGDDWAMQSLALIERRDSAAFDGTDQTWISIGARPMWFLDDHWRLVLEAGYDHVDGATRDGGLLKTTIAAEWAPKRSFWSRPAVRGYLTWATWSDDFRGLIGTPTYSSETDGWSAGMQVEMWW